MKNYGVIDLGTNTFHLLVAGWENGAGFREQCRERRFVKLGEEGLERIGPDAYRRGLQTVREFKRIMESCRVDHLRAIGTAALRTADNGMAFIREVAEQTGIRVQLVDGDEEARLIHLGVIQAIPFDDEPRMIMDIGGGSVELIIADQHEVHWAQSFPVGVAVLQRRFHQSDPITQREIKALRHFLQCELDALFPVVKRFAIDELVGASGTFEVLEDLLPVDGNNPLHTTFSTSVFHPFFRHILTTTHRERLDMEKLPDSRADMFVVALLLLEFILRKTGARRIAVSKYAMKEGVLWEMRRER